MKHIFRWITVTWSILISLFWANQTKASSPKDISLRINKVRKTLKENSGAPNSPGPLEELPSKAYPFGEWVNWGNWSNWNNWSNWVNWNNWNNWAKWGNY